MFATLRHTPFVHLLFPKQCMGCGRDLSGENDYLCWNCHRELPLTQSAQVRDNPVERIFWGRMKIDWAMSLLYFSKGSAVQQIIHHLKYMNQPGLGIYLGKMMGNTILSSGRTAIPDVLIPLPLFAEKEEKRGYNQAEMLCRGIADTLHIPLVTKNVVRIRHTDSQTRKHRMERWDNVEGTFSVKDAAVLIDKHALLVDDVLTTGATLEACGAEMLKVPGLRLNVATLAVASH